MTSSETPIDRRDGAAATPASSGPSGRRPGGSGSRRALIALAVILVGAIFIAWSHRFHVTVAVIVMTLGWIAAVGSVYALIRIGTSASEDDPNEAAWWQPTGKREELEREKRSLLKTIKEVEFDREMGKLSDGDATEILRAYRGHAIEVIKALDHIDDGGPRSLREEIEREVKARLAVTASRTPKRKAKPGAEALAEANAGLGTELGGDLARTPPAETGNDDAKESAS